MVANNENLCKTITHRYFVQFHSFFFLCIEIEEMYIEYTVFSPKICHIHSGPLHQNASRPPTKELRQAPAEALNRFDKFGLP